MVVSGTQQGFKFEFTYLPSSPHILYLTRSLQTWPWEGCRGNWLAAWALYLISKECTSHSCILCRSRNPHSYRCCPLSLGPGTALLHTGGLHVAACAAYGKEYVWISLSEQKYFYFLFIALPVMQAVSLDLGSCCPLITDESLVVKTLVDSHFLSLCLINHFRTAGPDSDLHQLLILLSSSGVSSDWYLWELSSKCTRLDCLELKYPQSKPINWNVCVSLKFSLEGWS